MLEHVPAWLGRLARNVRAGHDRLTIADPALAIVDTALSLTSPAFADGARLPGRFTADGEGLSPPLAWPRPPAGTAALALIVEDPDAPAARPLVHAIVWSIPPDAAGIGEGGIAPDGDGAPDGSDTGRNSYLAEGWLPPDPPSGHGTHDYVFQLFALDAAPALPASPGRGAMVDAMAGHVLAAGILIGTYSREEPARIGPVAGMQPA